MIRAVAVVLVGGDADGDPPQVLDQRQPEHDRDRPQLSQRERGDGLVGRREAAEARHVHPPVNVREQLEHDVISTRVPRRRPVQQPGQLATVSSREVPTGRPNLLLDQIEIVEEPLARRCDPSFCHDGRRYQLVRLHQDGLVVLKPWQEPVRASLTINLMPSRDGLGVRLKLIDAQKLRSERQFATGRPRHDDAARARSGED